MSEAHDSKRQAVARNRIIPSPVMEEAIAIIKAWEDTDDFYADLAASLFALYERSASVEAGEPKEVSQLTPDGKLG